MPLLLSRNNNRETYATVYYVCIALVQLTFNSLYEISVRYGEGDVFGVNGVSDGEIMFTKTLFDLFFNLYSLI